MGRRYQLLAELQCSEYIETGVESETAQGLFRVKMRRTQGEKSESAAPQ